MKRRLTTAILLVLLLSCCGYWAFLWTEYTSHQRDLERLRGEVAQLRETSADNQAARKARGDLEELDQLRRNHAELGELASKISVLRQAQARQSQEVYSGGGDQVRRLEVENQQHRGELEQLKHASTTIAARRSVDGTQLEQIASFFRSYARNNKGKYPRDFTELRYYLPANVYPAIETNRFEILNQDDDVSADPGQQPLVRTRSADDQNVQLYLFSDGHVESRGGP